MNVNLLALLIDGLLGAKPAAAAPPLLPDDVELQTQLTDQPAAWRTLIVGYIENHVAPRYRAIPGLSVRGAPGSTAQSWNTPARIQQALTAASALPTWTRPSANQLPLASPGPLDRKLRSFRGPDDAASGFKLLGQYLSGVSLPPSAVASKVAATQTMLWLSALDAFFVRWIGVISAAEATNASIAEILALYRTEGDLTAPLSLKHVEERLPIAEWIRDISLDEPGRSRILPTIRLGLWSYPADVLFPPTGTWPPTAVEKQAQEALYKRLALVNWLVIIGGLDFMIERYYKEDGDSPPPQRQVTRLRTAVLEFMAGNRMGHRDNNDTSAQVAAYEAVMSDLTLVWPADRSGRVIVAPTTPERLVALALTEAGLFFSLPKDKGQGPVVEPPLALRYLAYNLQHARSSKPEFDRFIHCLSSAAVAANRQSDAKFAALKAALAPLGLRKKLALDPEVDSSEHVDEFEKLSTPPDAFFDDPANMALLADFVLRAEHGHWQAFEKNRGNLARYRTLLAFYGALLA
ncbi:MAG: hypothetical protein ING46_18460 [Rubrivivax sp.]|nr:hypothetical protein [Rubrivivax sp.]